MMGTMLIVSVAFLGLVVVCDSYPGSIHELEQVNEENIENPIVKKDRDKRNADHPPDNTEEFKPVDQSVAQLANDEGFLKNLKNVFGENKQAIAPANFMFDESMFNFNNENNTGMEDRLQPSRSITDKFNGFVTKTTQTPIATAKNHLHTDDKNNQDDQIQKVFGSPPYHVRHETVTSPQMITQTKNESVENTTETDYRFTSAHIIKESYNRMAKGGSSTNITLFYMYLISLFVLLF